MRYIVILKEKTTFATNWYDEEKWGDAIFCIIDTSNQNVTYDGKNWIEPIEDNL